MKKKSIFTLILLALCLIGLCRVYPLTDKEIVKEDVTPSTTKDLSRVVAEPVDLGLSVLWASWNVGATAPEEDGYYYAWGELEPKKYYDWETYSLCKGTIKTCKDLDEISGTEYDVAHVKWGGKWRMPTRAEVRELTNRCNTLWKVKNGKIGVELGRKVKGKNVSIFLPASGYYYQGSLRDLGDGKGALKFGCYWSGTQRNLNGGRALAMVFKARMEFPERAGRGDNLRCEGLCIRPVMDK